MANDRRFDIAILGATGFTGRLVAEYLLRQYGVGKDVHWCLAGRSATRLEALRDELGAEIPIVVADTADEGAVLHLVREARVICTTVGPYALYGSGLVAACAAEGTHYCDLTGEVQWMRQMIDQHQQTAEASGARIVHTCGFDSIPSDIGTWFMQDQMLRQHGVAARQVKFRMGGASGTISGGTIASLINVIEETAKDPELKDIVDDPYSLLPAGAPRGSDPLDQTGAIFDEDFERWTIPFVMAAINTRVVRRSNALLGFPWGTQFRYDESVLMPESNSALVGKLIAAAGALGMRASTGALEIGPLRALASRLLPQPGSGPSEKQREEGFFEVLLHACHPADKVLDLRGRVTGDRDPGYGSTSKMLAESAVCLAQDDLAVGGGIWTPAAAMAEPLFERLQHNAGLTFEILE